MHHRITRLEREIEELKFEDDKIREDVDKVKRELVDKTPEHFGKRDVLRAFMGSLFFGFSVAFSSNTLNIAKNITGNHLLLVFLFILIILTSEIYFIGYSRVVDKARRRFGQFWLKRIVAFYLIALLVSFMIAYIFGLVYLTDSPSHFYNLVVIISAPASIGASVSDLLKKY